MVTQKKRQKQNESNCLKKDADLNETKVNGYQKKDRNETKVIVKKKMRI